MLQAFQLFSISYLLFVSSPLKTVPIQCQVDTAVSIITDIAGVAPNNVRIFPNFFFHFSTLPKQETAALLPLALKTVTQLSNSGLCQHNTNTPLNPLIHQLTPTDIFSRPAQHGTSPPPKPFCKVSRRPPQRPPQHASNPLISTRK